MQESKEEFKLLNLAIALVYILVVLEIIVFFPKSLGVVDLFRQRLGSTTVYSNLLYSKLFTILFVFIASIGSKPKKKLNINVTKYIFLPILFGLTFTFLSVFLYDNILDFKIFNYPVNYWLYWLLSFVAIILIHIGLDSMSKIIQTNFLSDKYNIENESFMQSKQIEESESSVNIPMLFYYKKRVHKGYINIVNIFRGLLVLGVPGSGKTFGVIVPYIKQLLNKGFTMLIIDYKYPDMVNLGYYYYLKNKAKNPKMKFHVINLNDVERSRRVNPMRPDYINTLADASETADTLVHALQKSDSTSGSEKFFTQSAINFLASVIYFFSKYENGKYSTFPHMLNFISRDYESIFNTLYKNDELEELLSPFKVAYDNKSFSQLDGQIGTLRIFLSRLATKETAWVFTGDDLELKLSSKENPSIIVIANEEKTQAVNSASNALILNRIAKLVNTKGNLPSAIVVDESPTIYFHKIDKLIATARSNKVGVLLGIQEIPQLTAGYSKNTADVITSVIGNVISGAVRQKETLQWLQQLFGKIKQKKEGLSIDRNKTTVSLNENLDYVIPESKIASLKQGEVVGKIVSDSDKYDGQFKNQNYNCKINLDVSQIVGEEKHYKKPKKYYNFGEENEKDFILKENYNRIKNDVTKIILDSD